MEARIDRAIPDRASAPKPDIRLMHIALRQVAVFDASNFPLAFSAAGGDTASTLATGCPVVVKEHPAHTGTSKLARRAIQNAVKKCGMPAGPFALIQGSGTETGVALMEKTPGVMLHAGIKQNYQSGLEKLTTIKEVEWVGEVRKQEAGCLATPALLKTTVATLLKKPEIEKEVFDPSSVIIVCKSRQEMLAAAQKLQGQLTANIHRTVSELDEHSRSAQNTPT